MHLDSDRSGREPPNPPLQRSGRRRPPGRARAAALSLVATLLPAAVRAAPPPPALAAIRDYRSAHEAGILAELFELLAIPNVASDAGNIRRNAEQLRQMLASRGLRALLLETDGAPPAVFAELRAPAAERTVVFYAHYDGQPADPGQWTDPPWSPTLRRGSLADGAARIPRAALAGSIDGDWRLYARSASDDKGPIVALLAALDALRAAGRDPSVHLKFFFEGEEEAGSPHLAELLRQHSDLLAGDLWIFCDGPVHQSGRGQVVFGVRGITELEITVYGPSRPLHSGHYGNWAPNPIAVLAELVAGMRDGDGTVRIPGFYSHVRPLSAAARRAVQAIPDVANELRRELGLARSEAGNARLVERLLLPAMNLRGFRAGRVGAEAQNAIPTSAQASIDFRLVPDLTPEKVRRLVEDHIRSQGFHIVTDPPDPATRLAEPKIVRLEWGEGYPPLQTPLDLPAAQAVARAVDEALGEPAIRLPTLGGSLPLYLFREILGTPVIVVPVVNHDNNQHAPDENLRLQNLWTGIEVYGNLMARLGELWQALAPDQSAGSGGGPSGM